MPDRERNTVPDGRDRDWPGDSCASCSDDHRARPDGSNGGSRGQPGSDDHHGNGDHRDRLCDHPGGNLACDPHADPGDVPLLRHRGSRPGGCADPRPGHADVRSGGLRESHHGGHDQRAYLRACLPFCPHGDPGGVQPGDLHERHRVPPDHQNPGRDGRRAVHHDALDDALSAFRRAAHLGDQHAFVRGALHGGPAVLRNSGRGVAQRGVHRVAGRVVLCWQGEPVR